ncbi:MAG: hypothetical protein ACOCYO_06115 [Bacteroidota bacterium]
MNLKLFTTIGISSALSLTLQAETLPQNQSDSETRETRPNILMFMVDDLVPALNSRFNESDVVLNENWIYIEYEEGIRCCLTE